GLYNFRDTRIRMLRAETVEELFAVLDEIKVKWGDFPQG
ncbi:MAG: tRNA dihydrouridine synthase DusB, partial [Bacteroidales bacterium]|nr:tRNA dihydrouridine synthase DusB [Bacteroidales bacterium]